MSLTRGIVLQPENSIDVEPGAVTLIDQSRFKNDGTITAGAGGYVQLPSGAWVYSFDGAASVINCGNISVLDRATGLTVSIWIRNDGGGDNAGAYISRIKTGTYNGFAIQLIGANNSIRLFGFNSAASAINETITVGAWTHLFATWNGTIHSLSVNGGAPATSAAQGASPMDTGGLDLTIGKLNYAALYVECSIAFERIYTIALSTGAGQLFYEKEKHWFGIN